MVSGIVLQEAPGIVVPKASSQQQRIRKTLREVAKIQALTHPLDYEDESKALFNARGQREDAVRGFVIHLATAMEDMLDQLYRHDLVGYRPASKPPKRPRGPRTRELDDLLESGKLNFDAKLRLARIAGLITKSQYRKLDKLRLLRNKCAHNWILDIVKKRGRKPRPSKRLLEYNGKNLFKVDVLEGLLADYGPVYLSMFEKLIS